MAFSLRYPELHPVVQYPITSGQTVTVGSLVRQDGANRVRVAVTADTTWLGLCIGLPDGSGTGNAGGTIRAAVAVFTGQPILVTDYTLSALPGAMLDLATGAAGLTTAANNDVVVLAQRAHDGVFATDVCAVADRLYIAPASVTVPLAAHAATATLHIDADERTALTAAAGGNGLDATRLPMTAGAGAGATMTAAQATAVAGADMTLIPDANEKAGLAGLTAAVAAVTAAQTDALIAAHGQVPTADEKAGLVGLTLANSVVTQAKFDTRLGASVDHHYHRYEDVALGATNVVAQFAGNAASGQAITAHPDVPRNLQVTFGADWTGGTITMAGLDASGTAITEDFAFPPGGGVTPGTLAFVSLTSEAHVPGAPGGAANTADVQLRATADTLLGALHVPVTAFTLLKVDGVPEAFLATVEANGTFQPTTDPNAAHDYEVWYTAARSA